MVQLAVDEIIDPHMHLFDLKGTPRPMQPLGKMFGWNDKVLRLMAKKLMPADTISFFGEQTDLLGDYLPQHFRADCCSSKVGRYVHIQAGWTDEHPMDPVGETDWLESLDDGPAAIVAHADLSLGKPIALVLDAHKEASDRVRGIRHMLSWHESDHIMNFAHGSELSRTASFRHGFNQLAEHELSFDAWCYESQLDEVAELAAFNPEVPMALCHAGTPIGYGGEFGGFGGSAQDRARIREQWRDGISAVAEQLHVRCKLSGLLMPALGFGYERQATAPTVSQLVDSLSEIIEHCVDAFGPERCMVASNFPVDKVSASYDTVSSAMIEMTSRYGPTAQQAMFNTTAAEFYRI